MYVAIVSYRCYKSRSGDVAYVAIVSEACCKCMFGVFQMFQRYVSSVFSGRMLQVFIWMLHMFHTYVACVLLGCCILSGTKNKGYPQSMIKKSKTMTETATHKRDEPK
jgi:hypothetical protein